jgi:hypothetical protein
MVPNQPQHNGPARTPDDDPTGADVAAPAREDVWAELGLPAPDWDDAALQSRSPPVDRNLIRAALDGRLDDQTQRRVFVWTSIFRAWGEASREVALEILAQRRDDRPEALGE